MAKSSFWDDLGNTLTRKAKGLSSRAENLYEIQKIRNKLSAQERMTEKLMMDIGKMIYTRYEQGEAVDGETGAICEEISQHMLEADHYRDAIAASKGEKFCPACHKAVMREASFCPYCGAACPTAELEEKAADVIEQADEELEEAAEAGGDRSTGDRRRKKRRSYRSGSRSGRDSRSVRSSRNRRSYRSGSKNRRSVRNRNIRIRSGIGRGKNGSGICRNRGACG